MEIRAGSSGPKNNQSSVPSIKYQISVDVFVHKRLLTMSLAPNEVSCVICEKSPDLACIMETWLYGSISDTCLHIADYNFIYKNRSVGGHGGDGVYVKNSIFHKRLVQFELSDFKVLWVYRRPKKPPTRHKKTPHA